jgi:hypothetical protein
MESNWNRGKQGLQGEGKGGAATREALFSEECNLAEGKRSARRAAKQTGQKTGYISGAQRGKQARGSSNQRSAYLLPKEARRDQGGKRKGRAAGAGRGGRQAQKQILSPALARCGKHCATGCRSSGSVPTAGGRSVDASRDKGVVRKTDARNEGMKKGCEEQGEGPGKRKATGYFQTRSASSINRGLALVI